LGDFALRPDKFIQLNLRFIYSRKNLQQESSSEIDLTKLASDIVHFQTSELCIPSGTVSRFKRPFTPIPEQRAQLEPLLSTGNTVN
jgi:hypothetical protein